MDFLLCAPYLSGPQTFPHSNITSTWKYLPRPHPLIRSANASCLPFGLHMISLFHSFYCPVLHKYAPFNNVCALRREWRCISHFRNLTCGSSEQCWCCLYVIQHSFTCILPQALPALPNLYHHQHRSHFTARKAHALRITDALKQLVQGHTAHQVQGCNKDPLARQPQLLIL